ncbi:MAG TPA: hypothetical protein VF487_10665 [Chitinophagaceae bacterium]
MFKSYSFIIAVILIPLFFTGCVSTKKIDAYVAGQFNNQLPKPDKKNDSSISIKSSIPSDPNIISVTEKKSKNLPLILYWKYDYRHTTTLNSSIGVNYFRKAIYQQAGKLKQKLNGQQLELNVEQIPSSFAIVDKGHIILLFIHLYKLYVEPDSKDLIVSYRVLQNGSETKSGKITVSNIERNRGIRFAQSWKSSTSEFLAQYNPDITEMAKTVVNKLVLEL